MLFQILTIRKNGNENNVRIEISDGMNEVLIDSNIIIGSIKGRFSISRLAANKSYVSEISRLEVLGYHKIKPSEEIHILIFLQHIDHIPISKEVIDRAISIRKNKSMSVGDAIIAATALLNDLRSEERRVGKDCRTQQSP